MIDLECQDIKFLPGVGPQRAKLLGDELQIRTLHDLLYTFPYKRDIRVADNSIVF